MEESYSCYGCGYVTNEATTAQCPRCGRRLRSAKLGRRLGLMQLLLGLVLVGLMGTIAFNLAPSLLQPGERAGGSRFTGTADQALVILGLFGLLIAFGLTSIVSGLWQALTGRRNKWIFIFMLGLFVILAFLGWLVRTTLGG